ncbi:MAG: gamma-glutamyltransferase family protein [Acuticoccus sp.]
MNFSQRLLYPSARSTSFGRVAVATSEPLAAAVGLDVLVRGGNAVDAAIATAAVLTVTEPVSNGLGSDAFALVADGNAVHGLNGSGRAPKGWTREYFAGRDEMPQRGWNTVTIPGAVSAWVALNARFGSRSLAELLEPAANYARHGYGVGPVTAAAWQAQADVFTGNNGFAETFLPGGKAPAAGDLVRLPETADALDLIARTDGAAFYRGAIAEAIVAQSAAEGGVHTMDDFAAHTADWVTPISQRACGYDIHEIPPNGQGLAVLIALGILERLDLGPDPDGVRAYHMQIEAVKLAMADAHAHIADPAAMAEPPESFLDSAYLDARAALVDPEKVGTPDTGKPPRGGTVLLTTADADGRMVSFIQSNFDGFGSGCVTRRFGVSCQNRGAAFSLDPASPNCVAPGKRPYHTIIPAIATRDGAPAMAFGMMGGPIQAQGHAQLVTRMGRFGQAPQTAIDAPRFRALEGVRVAVEDHCPPETVAGLKALGHDVVHDAPGVAFGFGGAQAIVRHGALYGAGSDGRKDGQALVR